ncbi:MAG: metal-dependent phosphohydrolase [Ilumatobacteraceae bacterium]
MSDDAELRAAWTGAIGAGREALVVFDEVVSRHREPQRRYHGVRHVTWVVRHVHALATEPGIQVGDMGAVIAAAFFHDAIYDPTRSDNEARSAELAEQRLAALGWPATRCREVGRLVQATASHALDDDGAGVDDGGAVLLDADLAVLGSDPGAYQAYVTGVRAEYAHVDDASWRAGRSAVLRGLLERQPIYLTPPARGRWEARAGANMATELDALR